jgi:hypothetical protein
MSNAPSTLDAPSSTSSSDESAANLLALVRSASETLRNRFEFASFWSAVLLPLGYVPMVFGGGSQQTAFVVLILLHAVALVAGHDYRGE